MAGRTPDAVQYCGGRAPRCLGHVGVGVMAPAVRKRSLGRLSVAAVAAAFGLAMTMPAAAAASDTVSFADAALAQCVASELGKDPGASITLAEAQNVYVLSCATMHIADLAGIENLTSLTSLNLNDNAIADISPLSGLNGLYVLELRSNRIADASPLGGLPHPNALYLSGNLITDVSGLAGLTTLTGLDIDDNQVTDISSLAGLTQLQGLHASHNRIADAPQFSTLTALRTLDLSSNQIVDPSPLASLHALAELDLDGNQIVDPSTLAALTQLTYLRLSSNRISDVSSLDRLASGTKVYTGGQSLSYTVDVCKPVQLPLKGLGGEDIRLSWTTYLWYLDRSSDGVITALRPGTYTVSFGPVIPDFSGIGFSGSVSLHVVGSDYAATVTTLRGAAVVGSTIVADSSGWSPRPEHMLYSWMRNGALLSLPLTTDRYTLTSADVGKRITVTIIASTPGYTYTSSQSAPTTAVVRGLISAKTPKITGTAKVKKVLKVKVSAWAPAPVKLSYQWRRDGVPIAKATKSSYKLAKADRRHRITVVVTGTKKDYATASSTSKATRVVR